MISAFCLTTDSNRERKADASVAYRSSGGWSRSRENSGIGLSGSKLGSVSSEERLGLVAGRRRGGIYVYEIGRDGLLFFVFSPWRVRRSLIDD